MEGLSAPSRRVEVERADIAALARKYRTLVRLHRALLDWQDARVAELDGGLAAEFPGALRELQTTPLEALEARAADCERAAASDEPWPAWMTWMVDYHRTLRRFLDDKRAGARGREPGGRLVDSVLRELGARHGILSDTITATLFPHLPRRRAKRDSDGNVQ